MDIPHEKQPSSVVDILDSDISANQVGFNQKECKQRFLQFSYLFHLDS
jgi:hypothetical protein